MLALLVCVPFVGALLVCCLSSRLRIQPAWLAGLSVLLGLTLLSGTATLAGILVADLTYVVADPRVRRG